MAIRNWFRVGGLVCLVVTVVACSSKQPTSPDPGCRNGILEQPEVCDDGNNLDLDTCSECTCADPDGGINPTAPARSRSQSIGITDHCISTLSHPDFGRLAEHYCEDGKLEVTFMTCKPGHYCPTTHSSDHEVPSRCRPCRATENEAAAGCSDLNDNDCDGAIDAADSDCP